MNKFARLRAELEAIRAEVEIMRERYSHMVLRFGTDQHGCMCVSAFAGDEQITDWTAIPDE